MRLQPLVEAGEVVFAGSDKVRQFVQLGQPNGGLYVGHLEVVADLHEEVTVVVGLLQAGDLPLEAVAAGSLGGAVVIALAVTAPVAHAAGETGQAWIAGEHRASLAGGHVVSRVEAEGRHVAKGAHHPPVVGGSQRVADVLNDVETVGAGEIHHRLHLDWIA